MKKRILLTLPFLFLATNLHSYKSEDLEKLQNTGACAKCDLSGANFYEADLRCTLCGRPSVQYGKCTGFFGRPNIAKQS